MKKLAHIAFYVFCLCLLAAVGPVRADGNDDNNNCYDQFHGGDMKAAISFCTKAIDSGDLAEPDLVAALINRGVAFKNVGETRRAVVDYTAALKHAPKDAMIYANRANARREIGELKTALADANQAIRLDPARGASFYVRGTIRESAGQLDGARKDYMQALALEPENMDYQNRILSLDAKRVRAREGAGR